MFRQALCVLTVVAMVANQLAQFPHAHAGFSAEEQGHHASRPHFHLGSGWHSHHHEPTCSLAETVVAETSSPHDADAVYLALGGQASSRPTHQRSVDCAEIAIAIPSAASAMLPDLGDTWATFRPPDFTPGAGKIYLTMRTLRI